MKEWPSPSRSFAREWRGVRQAASEHDPTGKRRMIPAAPPPISLVGSSPGAMIHENGAEGRPQVAPKDQLPDAGVGRLARRLR
jgi:hypothetical protein